MTEDILELKEKILQLENRCQMQSELIAELKNIIKYKNYKINKLTDSEIIK